ncbi:STY4528 family pathogenicity island replication protein [Pseudomonas sp. H11T01]|uniref:STY4528 family pathogenicity island replication protein n=1 Tax=Pseudomonas sp. H11T01 TaxID=3402749 RepID=UPI003AD1ADE7
MAHQHTHQNSQDQDALRTTVLSLTIDIRLTPLDRNCWHVMRMLRSAGGLYPLAGMGQLRSYLSCTPLAKRAAFDTAWRTVVVLRLTGWISLVGQHCDPLTDSVLNVLYQVNESALDFQQACALDPSLPELLQTCIGHKNSHLDRLAKHIVSTLEPKAASISTEEQRNDEDDPPPPSTPSRKRPPANQISASSDSVSSTTVTQQTKQAPQMPHEPDSTYKTYMYKKERTYRAHTREESDTPSASVALPACLNNAKADQQRDVLAALSRLPSQHRQDVLDELQARSQGGTVRNVVAYFFALVKRVSAGEFRLWAGRKKAQSANEPDEIRPVAPVRTEVCKKPPAQPAWREAGRPHLANMRKILSGSMSAGDLATQMMEAKEWQASPA